MRKSSQLGIKDGCMYGSKLNLTKTTPGMIRASIIRNVTKRLIEGEPIDDLYAELDSLFYMRKYNWENLRQKEENLNKYVSIIKNYVEFEKEREHQRVYLDDTDTIVNVFGEDIEVTPDFIIESDDSVSICKISTGKGTTVNPTSIEGYAYGLLGQKLYPDKDIYIEYLNLDINRTADYKNVEFNNIKSYLFDTTLKDVIETNHEIEEEHGCTGNACMGCSKYNICHYTEPPIAVNVEHTVKPVSDIRLTNDQRQIVDFESGIARVNAGAGAGKTLVVALRVAELLEKGYNPEDFSLLTFTNAGASEMTARVMTYAAEKGIPLDPEKFSSGTINGFCQKIVSEHFAELGFTREPRVVPDEIRMQIINDVIGNKLPHVKGWKYDKYQDRTTYNPFDKSSALNMAIRFFDEIKANGYTRNDHPYRLEGKDLDIIFQAYDLYNEELHSRNFLEFADQLGYVNKLYETHPDLFEGLGFKHIIIDEFQDTDPQQIQLLSKIIDTNHFKSFMAVGDDSQSIFSFRNTSPEFMINFERYFGAFNDFRLTLNHRSNKATIDFANKINDLSNERVIKDLISTKEEGIKPRIEGMYTENEEYEWIAEEIKKRWETGERDIAVMAFTKNELKKIASELSKRNIPSTLMCPTPFVENSRVAALTSFYDAFFNGSSQGYADYQNVLEHGAFKDMSATQIEERAEQFKAELSDTTRSLKEFMNFAKKLDENEVDTCYQKFLDKIKFCENTNELREFMNAFELYGINSEYKREGRFEGVSLTTIHSAKGLEWETTYLSLSKMDKIAFHRNERSFMRSKAHDEMQRLFFVGATRARNELIVTGQYLINKPSIRNGIKMNRYMKQAYELSGKVIGYNYASYAARVNYETQKIKEELGENIPTLPNVTIQNHSNTSTRQQQLERG